MGGTGLPGHFRLETDINVIGNFCFTIAVPVAEPSVTKRKWPETDLLFFSFVHVDAVRALTLKPVTELHAQNCSSHIPICSDPGRTEVNWSANLHLHVCGTVHTFVNAVRHTKLG